VTERLAIDASALIAILKRETGYEALADALIDPEVIIGAPTLLEVHIWMQRRLDRLHIPWFDEWLGSASTRVVVFNAEMEGFAARAYGRFGKGIHPESLNYGDCMAYAVAVSAGVPLLFKGGDFGRTDVAIHPASVLI